MTKNSNREISESEDHVTATLGFALASRPVIPNLVLQVSTIVDILRLLDGMKGGLVEVRGGPPTDQAFLIMQTDKDTNNLFRIVSPFLQSRLVTPLTTSQWYQKTFYTPMSSRTRKVGGVSVTEEFVNTNFVGTRWICVLTGASTRSMIYFILAYIELLLDAFPKVAGFPASLGWQAMNKVGNWPCTSFVKYAKYCSAYPMARYMKQEDLPKLPTGLLSHRIFGGKIEKILRSRLVSINNHSSRFFFSLLQGLKRACNVVPMSFLKEAKLQHATILSTPTQKLDPEFLMGPFSSLSRKLLSRLHLSKRSITHYTFPSMSASYEQGRPLGGQYRGIAEELDILEPPSEETKTLRFNADTLLGIEETNRGLEEFRGISLPEKYELLEKAFLAFNSDHPINCKVVGLSEPLKVRTITAGESLPYYLAKPFQKTFWGYLRDYPQFVAIGEPIDQDHLTRLINRESDLLALGFDVPVEFFVSGDYSAATDNLKIEYTLQAFDVLTEMVMKNNRSDELFLLNYLELMRKCLSPHMLHYRDRDGSLYRALLKAGRNPVHMDLIGYTFILQKNGQLMGSPISFPFLCMINLICYWHSLNTFCGRHVPLKYLPVLVNGDDILFRSNKDHYAIWNFVISEVGFKLSMGKNYCHRTLLTINSELYRFKTHSEVEFERLEYFNVGLLIAQSKGRLADPRRRLSIADLYRYSVGAALNKTRAHRRFLHYNRLIIKQMTDNGKFNLFIPRHLGGLGLPFYPELLPEIRITNFQRRFASFLLEKVNEQLRLGVYPRKYFAALSADNESLKTIYRRHGLPELCISGSEPPLGFIPYVPPQGITQPALTASPSLVLDREGGNLLYRLPSRHLVKAFNRTQFNIFQGNLKDSSLVRALSDSSLLSQQSCFLHRKDPSFSDPQLNDDLELRQLNRDVFPNLKVASN